MYLRSFLTTACAGIVLSALSLHAQEGPFDPGQWPATIDPTKLVNYVAVDGFLSPPSESWDGTALAIQTGGDQITTPVTLVGVGGLKADAQYLNVKDNQSARWESFGQIDILVQFFGNGAILTAAGNPRNFNFLQGSLPTLTAPNGGQLPREARNGRWNWALFSVSNNELPDGSGLRFVRGGSGVNGGTMRFEAVPGLIVRAIAFGEPGAFGPREEINKFLEPLPCEPEPETNLVGIDVHAGTSDHVVILNNGDQLTTIVEGVGPEGDKRKAVVANGSFINFAVTDNYLGLPCNDPHAVKVCVDYYDDPEKAGVSFGPEAFSTDRDGSIQIGTQRQLLEGTGVWRRRSFTVAGVSLFGVNVAPLTAGPRFIFEGGAVAISRFEMAVLRNGTHPLANQDPLADCFRDDKICQGVYGNFAEMDLAAGTFVGLQPGSSGGDQVMIQEEAGPTNDRRMSIRAALGDGNNGFNNQYLNFAIVPIVVDGEEPKLPFGPSSQDNARLAICMTYYDDPDLIGQTFRPEVYKTEQFGSETLAFTPGSIAVALEGTGQWREAYFEIPNVNFSGVNQGPQAAARFVVSHPNGKIAFSRVRYAVIRPCGPLADVNLLEDCKGVRLSLASLANGKLKFSWPKTQVGYSLQTSSTIGADAVWTTLGDVPVEEGETFTIELTPAGTGYYRLAK
ncbi:MAG: hypothetical protein JNN07_14565 [Verrucomicrobiales bacterium]|nr:hypothetical protein [Verrucomicrobiales bacterium]